MILNDIILYFVILYIYTPQLFRQAIPPTQLAMLAARAGFLRLDPETFPISCFLNIWYDEISDEHWFKILK